MIQEIPIEITHVPGRLRTDFDGKLPEATHGTPEERNANFLTRALAAFAIHKLSGCSLEDAAQAVVDGSGDGGIDAIYYSPTSHTLWVVQSKFHQNGRGEPALGDVTKFKAGLEDLLQGRFEAFGANPAWKKRLPKIQALLGYSSPQIRAALVYSGITLVSEDRKRLLEDLCGRFSAADPDYLRWLSCNLTTVHDWITGSDSAPGVAEVEMKLLNPGWTRTPYETIYGLLPLNELAKLHQVHGRKLIASNILTPKRFSGFYRHTEQPYFK